MNCTRIKNAFLIIILFGCTAALQGQVTLDKVILVMESAKPAHKKFLASPDKTSQFSVKTPEYKNSEAIFCRLEDAIRNTSGLLCKFRIGDVDYVDRLEGKYIPTVMHNDNPFLYARSISTHIEKPSKIKSRKD